MPLSVPSLSAARARTTALLYKSPPGRHRSRGVPPTAHGTSATVLPGGAFRAEFPAGIAGVAPGQSAVLYDGDAVLGGGFIR